jgi:hypothetical protein
MANTKDYIALPTKYKENFPGNNRLSETSIRSDIPEILRLT